MDFGLYDQSGYEKLLLSFGVGEVGRVGRFYLCKDFSCRRSLVVGVTVHQAHIPPAHPAWLVESHIVPFELIKQRLAPPWIDIFPSISYRSEGGVPNGLRKRICEEIEAKGLGLHSVFKGSDLAFSETEIGSGCWIQENCNIQTGVVIGKGVVCWAGAHVGHGSQVEDFCWVTSNATICGETVIGECTFIGANAVIFPGVRIGKRNIISAGALISKDTPDDAVYMDGKNNLASRKSWEVSL